MLLGVKMSSNGFKDGHKALVLVPLWPCTRRCTWPSTALRYWSTLR
ncbi:hypothetical protein AVDCRST_MAG94-7278 [uncultured Leptolyngbya sp.]|uniref:Uncharacterized protein n=1 Tax=uncultured Leptolyngbya sp. TaxID=332963 RepID=A0A6J4Q1Y6_9CYAN|nr:hypothetical protein AVDCRST_MAG94-7278 [uncultured Leptolyngbya sp.]